MTRLIIPLKIACNKMYEITSNETVEELPYADTRASESLYAITNTQPGENTYAASKFQRDKVKSSAPENQET